MSKSQMVEVPRGWLTKLMALADTIESQTSDQNDVVMDAFKTRQDVSMLIGFISSAKELLK